MIDPKGNLVRVVQDPAIRWPDSFAMDTKRNIYFTRPRACPRIGILFKFEKFSKNKHSHIYDIASIIFFNSEEFGQKGILGQPPRFICRKRTETCIRLFRLIPGKRREKKSR